MNNNEQPTITPDSLAEMSREGCLKTILLTGANFALTWANIRSIQGGFDSTLDWILLGVNLASHGAQVGLALGRIGTNFNTLRNPDGTPANIAARAKFTLFKLIGDLLPLAGTAAAIGVDQLSRDIQTTPNPIMPTRTA